MQTWKKIKKNIDLWQVVLIRQLIIRAIREFFEKQLFFEVETPILTPQLIPESSISYFETCSANNKKLYLTASPEASIKKLLSVKKVNLFEITKSFRNQEYKSSLHNPEFTILEWYRVEADYKDIMRDCEKLVLFINKKIKEQKSKIKNTNKKLKSNNLVYQNRIIDLSLPWTRMNVDEALKKHAKISLSDLLDLAEIQTKKQETNKYPIEKIRKIASRKGYKVAKKDTWEQIFNQIFLNEVEPHIKKSKKPVFLYDYPLPLAALAKQKNEKVAERFELYIAGLEIANCYTELTNYKDHLKRFKTEQKIRAKKSKGQISKDVEFLKAIKMGLPKCSGIALGVDRLVMFLTNKAKIEDVLLFPLDKD